MKKILIFCCLFIAVLPSLHAARQIQTIVLMRHGEKLLFGLGQLNCKGLNRSLLLPRVLMAKYGKPDFIYAPNPQETTFEGTGFFNYIRPLTTIEPLAIQLNMPVNTRYGYTDIATLSAEILSPAYHQSLIFISWEHLQAYYMAKKIMSLAGGDRWDIPYWYEWDFDSLYVINIDWAASPVRVTFNHDHQQLQGQSKICPAIHDIAPQANNQLAEATQTERFIFIPEAEAQLPERGQLNCQGMNRALHLTERLSRAFPGIDKFIAAAPNDPVYDDAHVAHPYQRAMMTIEPATIHAGKPIHTPYGYKAITQMTMFLLDSSFYNKTLAIAWPRKEMLDLVQDVYQAVGGNVLEIPITLPDYDNMYVITVTRNKNNSTSTFNIVAENLNNQSSICPAPI